MKIIRTLIVLLASLPTIVITCAAAFVFLAIENDALVPDQPPANYQAVASGKALLKRIIQKVDSADKEFILAISEQEFRILALLGSHTFQHLNTDIHFNPTQITFRISLQLPPNPLGNYINFISQVPQSNEGIEIDRVQIGSMMLPGDWLLPLFSFLADTILQNQQATLLLSSIHGMRIEGDTALFKVHPPRDVKTRLKQAVKTLQAYRFTPGERERTVYYYGILVGISEQRYYRGTSFNDYLVPLLDEANKRQHNSSAVAENRAIVWALAIYFSSGVFETLVGDLVSSERRLARPPYNITLGGRTDLMQHFLYSAAIALATEQSIGIAVGEFKELLDSGNGGSGFSFADLAADRAGIRFAAEATSSEKLARQLQQSLVLHNNEEVFFPDISGLAEGLDEGTFQRQYGHTKSDSYLQLIELIDQRIARLLAYSGAGVKPG